MQLTFGNRVRATIIGGGASLILATAALAAPALAADQPATTTTEAIDAHTHQMHGTVKTAVSAGSTSFTLTTARYGDVSVSFTATTPNGHGQGHGKARSFELTSQTALTAGERLIVQGRTSADGKTFVARRVHVLPATADGNTSGTVTANGNGDGKGTSTATPTANTNANGNRNGNSHGTTHLVGNVSGATATTLSVTLADGTTQSVTVSADTAIRPQGKTLADLSVGTKVTVVSRSGAATGIVVMPA